MTISHLATSPILKLQALGFPWATIDPFLFCAYHDDAYPAGNVQMGPQSALTGRDIGQDFSRKDGWSMYHGETVPGFPAHPHRGFETVTIVRKGLIDHSDSLGARARFGEGDVQWLTAGAGIVHAEMFPLLNSAESNPLELFQIWLNLPARNKMVAPHFTMLWNETIPRYCEPDINGLAVEIAVVTGSLFDQALLNQPPLVTPPDSWAAQSDSDVAILTLKLAPGARWTFPAALGKGTLRSLYFFKGISLTVAGQEIIAHAAIQLRAEVAVELVNGPIESEFLLLQGRPIGEPVAQYGPFVMNTQTEIRQAMHDYQRTQFGGWPWPNSDPVHGIEPTRFAVHPDGRTERPSDLSKTDEIPS
jgi:quercetin 2,3-dioxygenase